MTRSFFVRSLSPWLAGIGCQRGDYLVDRQREPNRFAIVRALPLDQTRAMLYAEGTQRHLEEVLDMMSPEDHADACRTFTVIRGGLATRPDHSAGGDA